MRLYIIMIVCGMSSLKTSPRFIGEVKLCAIRELSEIACTQQICPLFSDGASNLAVGLDLPAARSSTVCISQLGL